MDEIGRRNFLKLAAAAGAGLLLPATGRADQILGVGGPGAPGAASRSPAIITSERLRPQLPSGVQTGDVTDTRAILWSRADRPSRMHVEWSTTEGFADHRIVRGPAALDVDAFTAKLDLRDLPPGERIFYRLSFESLEHPGTFSAPLDGSFRTAPGEGGDRPLRIAWSGDCVGQGWGIDPDRGGMRIFETMRRMEPDLFVHSGDNIYADQPLQSEVVLDDGSIYRNLVTEEKSKVAETLDEFRGNFAYTFLDPNARRFHAEVPVVTQWDDHEVVDNWFPGYRLDHDPRYTVKSASLLAARAQRAFFEFLPIRRNPDESERIYRSFSYGSLLDLFVLDLRSYRGPNTTNRQDHRGAESTILGEDQFEWLKRSLRESRATWKVIASDMPIGLVVPDRRRDGERTFEGIANAEDGVPAGREIEVADLLRFVKREGIRNTVWVTADVHYTAAHHYTPERASFTDFDPFWEFVAGPMHAGTFGPNAMDATFGPEVVFQSVAPAPNRPPSEDLQFFGILDVDPRHRTLRVGLHDVTGKVLWSRELAPEPR